MHSDLVNEGKAASVFGVGWIKGACWQTGEAALICLCLCWQQNTWERDFQLDSRHGNPLKHSNMQKCPKAHKRNQGLDHQNPESSLKLYRSNYRPVKYFFFYSLSQASCLWQHLLLCSLHIYQGSSKLCHTLSPAAIWTQQKGIST